MILAEFALSLNDSDRRRMKDHEIEDVHKVKLWLEENKNIKTFAAIRPKLNPPADTKYDDTDLTVSKYFSL